MALASSQMLAFNWVIEDFSINKVAHRHMCSHEDNCALKARGTVENGLPPREEASDCHNDSDECNSSVVSILS